MRVRVTECQSAALDLANNGLNAERGLCWLGGGIIEGTPNAMHSLAEAAEDFARDWGFGSDATGARTLARKIRKQLPR